MLTGAHGARAEHPHPLHRQRDPIGHRRRRAQGAPPPRRDRHRRHDVDRRAADELADEGRVRGRRRHAAVAPQPSGARRRPRPGDAHRRPGAGARQLGAPHATRRPRRARPRSSASSTSSPPTTARSPSASPSSTWRPSSCSRGRRSSTRAAARSRRSSPAPRRSCRWSTIWRRAYGWRPPWPTGGPRTGRASGRRAGSRWPTSSRPSWPRCPTSCSPRPACVQVSACSTSAAARDRRRVGPPSWSRPTASSSVPTCPAR